MDDQFEEQNRAPEQENPPEKPRERRVRADAQRNLDGLLQAALRVFAKSGVDAPVREIASEAGVGVGTLYRHFPHRSDLIIAVTRREMDACADAASELAKSHEPGEALSLWIDRYVDFLSAKRGIVAALHSGDPAYAALPAYFDQRLRPPLNSLLAAATAAGAIRDGVDADELLIAVARLSAPSQAGDTDLSRRMVALFVDGLRFGARA